MMIGVDRFLWSYHGLPSLAFHVSAVSSPANAFCSKDCLSSASADEFLLVHRRNVRLGY